MHTRYILMRLAGNIFMFSQPTYAYKIYLVQIIPAVKRFNSQPTYAYKIYQSAVRCCVVTSISQPTYAYKIYPSSICWSIFTHKLTTYICIQDISSNKYKYKLPTRIKFVGFIPCREYLLFYIRNLCILSRLKDAEPPLISVRISYVFFVCFSFALLIFKVFSIMSSIFFIPIF